MSETNPLQPQLIQSTRQLAGEIFSQVKTRMFGLDQVIRLCLVVYFTRGHVLLEGNPGLGKTELVKTLGTVMGLDWGRIQFTPDLLPSDITGTKMPTDTLNQLRFNPGPVFTQLLLADEINRATPKTQSAMLEAMAERQVTVLGDQYPVIPRGLLRDLLEQKRPIDEIRQEHSDDKRLFMVLATQNPIEQEGTFSLPEAQLDRFRFKLLVALPEPKHLREIMEKVSGNAEHPAPRPISYDGFAGADEAFQKVSAGVRVVPLTDEVRTHVFNLVYATNQQWSYLRGVGRRELGRLQTLARLIEVPLGPRAGESLLLGAKGWCLLWGDNKQQADALALSQVLLPALVHRLKMRPGWGDEYSALKSDHSGSQDELDKLGLWETFQVKSAERETLENEPAAQGKRQRDPLKQEASQLSWSELFLAHFSLLAAPREASGNHNYNQASAHYALLQSSLKKSLKPDVQETKSR